jgi:Cu(I)/Ag(I) efflux system membrane protein CusA/SilA
MPKGVTGIYINVCSLSGGIEMAKEYAKKSNEVIKSFPEVESTFAKAGRAESATDPAPLSMIETIIQLKPKEQWRVGMTYEKLRDEMNEQLQMLGLTNSWTYPIRGRIDMLITGIRTPLGIKLYGDNDQALEESANKIASVLANYEGTKSIFADKANSGYYLNMTLKPENIAAYGITKEEILNFVDNAFGSLIICKHTCYFIRTLFQRLVIVTVKFNAKRGTYTCNEHIDTPTNWICP